MEARKRAHGGKAAGARNGFVQHTPAGCTGIHMACGAVSVRMDAQDGCDLLEGEEGQLLDALKVLPTLCAEMPHTFTTGRFRPHPCGRTSAWPSPRSNSVPSAHKKGKAGVEYTAYLGGHLLFSLDISRTHRIARPRVLLRQRRRSRRLLLSQHHRIRLGRLPPSPKPTSPRRPMYAVCKPQVAPRFPGSRRRRNHERRCGAESKGLRRCCVQVPTSLPSRCLLHATRDTHDDVTSGKGFRAWRFFGGRV